jgi:hypothetical protein
MWSQCCESTIAFSLAPECACVLTLFRLLFSALICACALTLTHASYFPRPITPFRITLAALAKRKNTRSFSPPQPPVMTPSNLPVWDAVVNNKTAAMNERITGAINVMNLNNGVVEKAALATKEAVGSIKTDVDKAVGGMEKAVDGIKTDMEKVVGGIKTDMKEALKLEISAMEKVLKAEVSTVKDSFKSLERLFYIAIAVFIFGKPVLGGIKDVFDSAKEGIASSKKE